MVLTDWGFTPHLPLRESLSPQAGWSSGHRCCCCGCVHPMCGDSTFQLKSQQRVSSGGPGAHFFHPCAFPLSLGVQSSEEGMKNLGLPPSVGPHRCISAKAAEVSAVAELARAPRGCHGNQEQAPALVAEEGCGEKVTDKR